MMKKTYYPLTIEDKVLRIVKDWFEAEGDGDSEARVRSQALLERFLVETDDGTFTLHSSEMISGRELVHTTHGALREARKKFIEPANLQGKEKVNILDLCSGLGYNTTAALDILVEDKVDIKIDMVEISLETLALSLLIHIPLKSHKLVIKTIEKKLINEGFLTFEGGKLEFPSNTKVNIHCRDAREFIKSIKPYENELYDAVFLDPFSPGKTPELYSQEFFQGLSGLIKKNGLILTYTSAAPVRSALLEAGFHVGEGPSLGRRGGTMASPSISMISKPLSIHDERMIALSDAGIPFRDPELDRSAEEILIRRDQERKTARGYYKLASTVKTPVYLNREIKNHRLKRRVLEHLEQLGIMGLNSYMSRYLVCPQFSKCICYCGQGKKCGSRARIKEMSKRMNEIVKGESFDLRNKV
jgi:tRNA U34 5-methylaminomethyl-2-thiouridine-forming methyltransferase MnmC